MAPQITISRSKIVIEVKVQGHCLLKKDIKFNVIVILLQIRLEGIRNTDMCAIFTGFCNFPRFSPAYLARRKAREILNFVKIVHKLVPSKTF